MDANALNRESTWLNSLNGSKLVSAKKVLNSFSAT